MNFQALLQTAYKIFQSVYSQSGENFRRDIDRPDRSANQSHDGSQQDRLHSLSCACPTQLVVSSLDPPLAPSSDSVECAGDTAAGMRFLASVSPGQNLRRGFAADIFSGSDLDKLLNRSLSEDACRQSSDRAVGDYHIWRSTRLEDSEVSEQFPVWSPVLDVRQRKASPYQILPFFYNHRWQLAIFDKGERTLYCYDTMGDRGTPMSTFVVSVALALYCVVAHHNDIQVLQSWYETTFADEHCETLKWHVEKVCGSNAPVIRCY